MPLHPPASRHYPSFGPFDGEALQREINAEKAALAMRSIAAQVVIILAGLASTGIFIWTLWNQLEKYELALKHCAGV